MLAKHALSQLSYGPVTRRRMLHSHVEPKFASTGPPSQALRRGSLRSRWPAEPEAAEQRRLVGLGRLELPTSRLSSARSNQLSYKPLTLSLKRIGTCLRATSKAAGCVAQAQPPARVRPRRKRNEDGEIPPMELNDLTIVGP